MSTACAVRPNAEAGGGQNALDDRLSCHGAVSWALGGAGILAGVCYTGMTKRRWCVTAPARAASTSVQTPLRRQTRPPERRHAGATASARVPARRSPPRRRQRTSATSTAALPRSFARLDSRCVSRPMRSIAASTLGVEQLDDQHLEHRRRSAARARRRRPAACTPAEQHGGQRDLLAERAFVPEREPQPGQRDTGTH